MNTSTTAGTRARWCARDNDFPDGYLLWMPAFLSALDQGSDLASAMIWTLAVLLTGVTFWATGRGRAESWAETLFAFGWIGAWSLASGVLLLTDRAGDRVWMWAALGLASGVAALALAWSYRRRRQVRPPGSAEGRTAAGRDAMIWLAVCAGLFLLLGRAGTPWAAASILGPAFLCHLLLAPRGRGAIRPGTER